jgi:pre-mRNA-splicing factor SYF2
MVASSSGALVTTESLYRDANSLLYGDSKPSEDAIDRVVSKLNHESVFPSILVLYVYDNYLPI